MRLSKPLSSGADISSKCLSSWTRGNGFGGGGVQLCRQRTRLQPEVPTLSKKRLATLAPPPKLPVSECLSRPPASTWYYVPASSKARSVEAHLALNLYLDSSPFHKRGNLVLNHHSLKQTTLGITHCLWPPFCRFVHDHTRNCRGPLDVLLRTRSNRIRVFLFAVHVFRLLPRAALSPQLLDLTTASALKQQQLEQLSRSAVPASGSGQNNVQERLGVRA